MGWWRGVVFAVVDFSMELITVVVSLSMRNRWTQAWWSCSAVCDWTQPAWALVWGASPKRLAARGASTLNEWMVGGWMAGWKDVWMNGWMGELMGEWESNRSIVETRIDWWTRDGSMDELMMGGGDREMMHGWMAGWGDWLVCKFTRLCTHLAMLDGEWSNACVRENVCVHVCICLHCRVQMRRRRWSWLFYQILPSSVGWCLLKWQQVHFNKLYYIHSVWWGGN